MSSSASEDGGNIKGAFMEPASSRESKLEFWKRHLDQLSASGLTQAAYCRKHGLKWYQLHYWRRKLSEAGEPGGRLRLVPLRPVSSVQSPSPEPIQANHIEVIHNGLTIRVRPGFDADCLQKTIKALSQI